MAGSVLGAAQVAQLNAAFPAIKYHVRSMLKADPTPFGSMRAHVQAECMDTDELYHIFAALSFLSPTEKKALVRAAIFDVILLTDEMAEVQLAPPAPAEKPPAGPVVAATYAPAQFKLNAATVLPPHTGV